MDVVVVGTWHLDFGLRTYLRKPDGRRKGSISAKIARGKIETVAFESAEERYLENGRIPVDCNRRKLRGLVVFPNGFVSWFFLSQGWRGEIFNKWLQYNSRATLYMREEYAKILKPITPVL